MQLHDRAPLIFQAENDHGAFELRVLVQLDGKLAAYGREWLNQDQRNAVLDGKLQVARLLWVPETATLNDQVHWCVSDWRRQGFAPLVRNDLAFDVRQRRLIPGVDLGYLSLPTQRLSNSLCNEVGC